jgi:hypothetical protein
MVQVVSDAGKCPEMRVRIVLLLLMSPLNVLEQEGGVEKNFVTVTALKIGLLTFKNYLFLRHIKTSVFEQSVYARFALPTEAIKFSYGYLHFCTNCAE